MITGSNYEIRSSEIFEKLGWEKIETILKKREHIMTFKALRGKTPNYLSDLFVASHNDMYVSRHLINMQKREIGVLRGLGTRLGRQIGEGGLDQKLCLCQFVVIFNTYDKT